MTSEREDITTTVSNDNRITIHPRFIEDDTYTGIGDKIRSLIQKRIRYDNDGNDDKLPYTEVDLILPKRVRIYHQESFNLNPKYEVETPDPKTKNKRRSVNFEGMIQCQNTLIYDEDSDNGIWCGGDACDSDISDEAKVALKDKISFGEELKMGFSTEYATRFIVVMPKDEIQKQYVYGENMEDLKDHLYLPTIENGGYIQEKHPKGCRCDKCSDD